MLKRGLPSQLKTVFGAMLQRYHSGEKINPAAMTRFNYDRARASVLDTGLSYGPIPYHPTADGVFYPPHMTHSGKKHIQVKQNAFPGTATHELEHALGYDMTLGEKFGDKNAYFELISNYPELIRKLQASREPAIQELLKLDLGTLPPGYTTDRFPNQPEEAARALIRLWDTGPQDLRTDIKATMPVSTEILKRIPPEIQKMLVPYDQARGAIDFAARMGY